MNKKISFSIPTYRDRVECQEELYVLLENFFNEREFIDYKNFLFNIENICSEVYFYILAFLLDNKPFTKLNLMQYEKQMNLGNGKSTHSNNKFNIFSEITGNMLGKETNLIATPNLKSKLSPSVTLSKSPLIKYLNKEGPFEKFDLKMNLTELKNKIDNNFSVFNGDKNSNFNNTLNSNFNLKPSNFSDPLKPNILFNIENNFKKNHIGNNNNIIRVNNDKNNHSLNKNASPFGKKNEKSIPSKSRGAYENKLNNPYNIFNKVKGNSLIYSANETNAFFNQNRLNNNNMNCIDLDSSINKKNYGIQQNLNNISNLNYQNNPKNNEFFNNNEYIKSSRGIQPKNLINMFLIIFTYELVIIN